MTPGSPLDYPWRVDGRGRTRATDADDHVRDLIEQVLFTAPGERVMRPGFGAGLLAMVFEPGGQTVAATAQFLVQSALDATLADVIAVEQVEVEAAESTLVVTVSYAFRQTQTAHTVTFRAPGGSP